MRNATSSGLLAFLVPAIAIVLVAGCSIAPNTHYSDSVTPEMLIRGMPLSGQENPEPLKDVDILALSPEMLVFINQNVNAKHSMTLKLHQLLYAIIIEGTFGLEYDDTTRTASETFDAKQGNCLSFTSMFIAMAREAGLNASYQEVNIPPDWTRGGDTFVLNRHVNVLVDLGRSGEQVVDFNLDDFRSSYDRRTVPDSRAMAHYYNNIGVERLHERQYVAALRFFRKAVDSDKELASVWSNIGALSIHVQDTLNTQKLPIFTHWQSTRGNWPL